MHPTTALIYVPKLYRKFYQEKPTASLLVKTNLITTFFPKKLACRLINILFPIFGILLDQSNRPAKTQNSRIGTIEVVINIYQCVSELLPLLSPPLLFVRVTHFSDSSPDCHPAHPPKRCDEQVLLHLSLGLRGHDFETPLYLFLHFFHS